MVHYDVVIIGAGIAGMTAAIYARRGGKSVLVLEQRVQGGQIINTFDIANWPGEPGISGADLSQKIYHQVNNLGVEFEFSKVIAVHQSAYENSEETEVDAKGKQNFVVTTEDGEYSCGAIIIAVGSNERKMGVPGEEKYTGRGVSYCATCDGAFYKDKEVAVVGGGNTAFYDALYLADICKKVHLVHRRKEFRADTALIEKVQSRANVDFALPFVPVEVLGDKKVSGLKIRDVYSENGGEEEILHVEGVFVAVGRVPDTEVFKNIVELDDSGYVKAGEDCETSRAGIFVAGDCRTKGLRQLVTAAADGAVAATAAVRFLS